MIGVQQVPALAVRPSRVAVFPLTLFYSHRVNHADLYCFRIILKHIATHNILPVTQTAMTFAATGAAIELAMHERPNMVTTVSLSLWCVVRAVHCLWLALRDGPHTLQSTPALLKMLPADSVQKLLETAQTPPPPPMARALYQNAISCLPVLTLGLVFQEGARLSKGCGCVEGSPHSPRDWQITVLRLGAYFVCLVQGLCAPQ